MSFTFWLFSTSLDVSSLSREKGLVEKIAKDFLKELIYYKRSRKKCTGNVAYPFVKWKSFGIQVSSTDLYISVVKAPE